MTVAQFYSLKECDTHVVELRHGQVVRTPRHKKREMACACRIDARLAAAADRRGVAARMFTYHPLPEHEVRAADVAWVTRERWDQTDPDDNLHGAPEFVVDVVSPSHTAEELQERKHLCLVTGCLEYWTVYPKPLQVEVATPEGARVYELGEVIEVVSIPNLRMAVRDIFED